MPIRFDREISWTIEWRNEDVGFGQWQGKVGNATVFYRYRDQPCGYRHVPLPPLAEGCLEMIPAPEQNATK
jgi:hypothetical protein